MRPVSLCRGWPLRRGPGGLAMYCDSARARPTHAEVPASSGIPRVSGSKWRCLPWFQFALSFGCCRRKPGVCLWAQAPGRVPWARKPSRTGSPLLRGRTSAGCWNVTVCRDGRLCPREKSRHPPQAEPHAAWERRAGGGKVGGAARLGTQDVSPPACISPGLGQAAMGGVSLRKASGGLGMGGGQRKPSPCPARPPLPCL